MSDTLRVAALETPIDHEALRAALAGAWRELVGGDAPSDAISILLAQSSLETGRWKDAICWNLGGIKATASEPHTYYTTRERFPRERALALERASTTTAPCKLAKPDDGAAMLEVIVSPDHPYCRFRAYPDLASSVHDYLALIVHRYPNAISRAAAADVHGYVASLRAGGYFTGDATEYENDVALLFDEYKAPCLSSSDEVDAALASLDFDDVQCFQRDAGLLPDGVVGKNTRGAIRSRLAEAEA